MSSNNLLRQQVVSEKKKRQFIIVVLIVLSFLYLGINFLLGDAGFLKYRELSKKKVQIEREIAELNSENLQLRSQIKSLKDNPFYSEKYAREEFGLARPDEYIFQYGK
jgi:cell division protein FtsB